MIALFPCKLFQEFEVIHRGIKKRFKLLGFDKGVKNEFSLRVLQLEPSSCCGSGLGFLNYNTSGLEIEPKIKIEVQESIFDIVPLSNYGVKSKKSASFWGIYTEADGSIICDFIFPQYYHQHESYEAPFIFDLFKDLLSDHLIVG